MKINEIRKKTEQDLQKTLLDRREEVRALRFKIASKEVKNHQLMRGAKKDVARILTIMKERSK